MFDHLASRKLVIVSGKGGVGRTTVAALLGLALARRGRRVLVATTGHDDRLAWMLGRSRLDTAPIAVLDRLWVQRLEPQACLREYGAMILRSQRLASAAVDNGFVRRLLPAFPGLDDFSVLGKAWHEGVRSGNYDVVVFDGPSTGRVRYTLGVPGTILEVIPPGPLTREAEQMRRSLTDPSVTEAVLVGLPEPWPLTELGELAEALGAGLGIDVGTVVINGLLPRLSAAASAAASGPADGEVGPYLRWLATIESDARRQREALAGASTGSRVLTLPWRFEGVSARADLEALLGEAS